MSVATNNFADANYTRRGWSTSPYDLYWSFGEGRAFARGPWGAILDNEGEEDRRNPAKLDAEIRGSGLTRLKDKLSRVRTKRFRVTSAFGEFSLKQSEKETAKKVDGAPAKQLAVVRLGDNYSSQLTGAHYMNHRKSA